MRSLVIYDTLFGNTTRICGAIAEGLSERGSVTVLPVEDVAPGDVEHAQLVVIGGPTQLHGSSPSMRRLFRGPFRGVWDGRPVATFDTRLRDDAARTGSAAAALLDGLRDAGAYVAHPPESFFVAGYKGPLEEGETVRALLWGRSLHLGDRVAA